MKAQPKEGNLNMYQDNHSSESSGPNFQELGAITALHPGLLKQSEEYIVKHS